MFHQLPVRPPSRALQQPIWRSSPRPDLPKSCWPAPARIQNSPMRALSTALATSLLQHNKEGRCGGGGSRMLREEDSRGTGKMTMMCGVPPAQDSMQQQRQAAARAGLERLKLHGRGDHAPDGREMALTVIVIRRSPDERGAQTRVRQQACARFTEARTKDPPPEGKKQRGPAFESRSRNRVCRGRSA